MPHPARAQHRRDAIERVALADAAEVQLHAGPAEATRARCRVQRDVVHARRARAPPRSRLGDGRRPSRRRNPQQRLSGVVVTSKAPPVRGVEVAGSAASSAKRSRADLDGTARRRVPVDADELARLAEDGERASMRVDLVEGLRAPARRAARPRRGSVTSKRQAMARRWTRIQ